MNYFPPQVVAKYAAFVCAGSVLLAATFGMAFYIVTTQEAAVAASYGDPYTALGSEFLWLLVVSMFLMLSAICAAIISGVTVITNAIRRGVGTRSR